MEPEVSSPHSQQPTTSPYPEQDRSSLCPPPPPSNLSKINFAWSPVSTYIRTKNYENPSSSAETPTQSRFKGTHPAESNQSHKHTIPFQHIAV